MTDALLPALIQQMTAPAFYPHPVTAPIQVIQTHISYVLLTGDYAYKVKKPVNFGFLDFSTLAKRQHFCAEELRLNQRGAAELYLEVLPIIQTDDRFYLSGTGESDGTDAVEYVVKMQQFPQSSLFTELFDRGELTEDLLEQLARVLADFHARAETNDYIRSFGTVAKIRAAIDENYEQTLQYIGGPQTQQQLDETRDYTDRLFAEQQALFESRIAQNWIRECHGDVHLRNIALWHDASGHDKILLFDCIEFNEPFRFVDVMFDIAYIIMDLDARDRRDLSNRFLNAYIEQTGDWEGLQVLPLYLSRQSYVRAKVTSFLLSDPAVPEATKQEASATAARYYRLAWEYTQPQQGRVILMAGLSGSGKSTVARQLAQTRGAIQIRSDAVRKHLAGIPLEAHGGSDLYTAEMTQKTYDRLLKLGITLATQGYTVILDAKYDRQPLRQTAIEHAIAHQLPVQIIYCTAPLSVLQQRLQQRHDDISDATADLLPKQDMDDFSPTEQPYLVTLDTTQNLEAQLEKVSRGMKDKG